MRQSRLPLIGAVIQQQITSSRLLRQAPHYFDCRGAITNSNMFEAAQTASFFAHISLQAFCFQSLKTTSLLDSAVLGVTCISTGDELACNEFFFSNTSLTSGCFREAAFYLGFWILFWLVNKLRTILIWEHILLNHRFMFLLLPWPRFLSFISKPQNWHLFESL